MIHTDNTRKETNQYPETPFYRPIAREVVRELVQSPEFAELISEIASGQPAAPALLNARTLAQRLGVSPSTISALKKQGLPFLTVGMEARFDEAECMAWLRARQESGGAK